MSDEAEYWREKTERAFRELRADIARDGPRLEPARKLAAKWRDSGAPIEAHWLEEMFSPERSSIDIAAIKLRIDLGEFVEADKRIERVRLGREHAKALVLNRLAAPGFKQIEGLARARIEAATERKKVATGRTADWQRDADEYWARHPAASSREVALKLAPLFDVSTDTFRKKIKNPQKVGRLK